MKNTEHIDKLIEDALNSVDGIQRAEPKPFLLTRIHARMNNGTASLWEKAGWFITRPVVAFTGLCLVILINVMVIVKTGPVNANGNVDQVALNGTDEFSSTVATIYDIETQP